MAPALRLVAALSLITTACLAAGCSSSGGVIDNADLTRHWNGMSTSIADAQWGKAVSREALASGPYARHTWTIPGCQIQALVKDGYMSEVRTRATEIDGCNIVFARSRPLR